MQFIADNLLIIALLAATIILALAVYAGMMLRKLHVQQIRVQETRIKRQQDIKFSLVTIIKATLQQQCGVGEAVIRVRGLLDGLGDESLEFTSALPESNAFFQAIKHHPILAARKQIPKAQLKELDMQREELEAQYETSVHKELQSLLKTLEAH